MGKEIEHMTQREKKIKQKKLPVRGIGYQISQIIKLPQIVFINIFKELQKTIFKEVMYEDNVSINGCFQKRNVSYKK